MSGGVCRMCGCTDEFGCAEGCSWVEGDLCSACVRELAPRDYDGLVKAAASEIGDLAAAGIKPGGYASFERRARLIVRRILGEVGVRRAKHAPMRRSRAR